jgi:T4 RnlA family RNA ligase
MIKLPNPEQFVYRDCVIGGDECVHISPNKIDVDWCDENLIFRSIILRKSDHYVVSRGFDKFFNLGENPKADKMLETAKSIDYLNKEDGSLLIWGYHQGQLIHRTRGTVTAEIMPNGDEIKFLINKYKNLVTWVEKYSNFSVLTEWLTPTNIIVISGYDEPQLKLLGVIDNQTGELLKYEQLADIASETGVPLVERFQYSSIKDCVQDVNAWRGKEGVVVYLRNENGDTTLLKIKSDWYLKLHRIATGMSSIRSVLDVFMDSPRYTTFQEFYDYIVRTVDFEIAEKIKTDIQKIVDSYVKYSNILNQIHSDIDEIKKLNDRKAQAKIIIENYKGGLTAAAFLFLDNKPISDKILFNLLLDDLKQ